MCLKAYNFILTVYLYIVDLSDKLKINVMNKTIYKYQLEVEDKQLVKLPKNAEILSVQVQNGIPCIWALVDTNEELKDRIFEIFGTGHPIFCDVRIDRKFIGTFQMYSGSLIFHLFERIN